MDGFYVAKFKVERRTKKVAAEEMDEMVVDSKGELVENKADEDVGFDSEEDKPYLDGSFLRCVIVFRNRC